MKKSRLMATCTFCSLHFKDHYDSIDTSENTGIQIYLMKKHNIV